MLRWVPPLRQRLHDRAARRRDAAQRDWDFPIRYSGAATAGSRATCRSRWSRPRTRTSPATSGFDFKAIDKAIANNKRGRKVRGASTISQQLAKNLFLWQGRSYLRKGLEAWYTVLIEADLAEATDHRGVRERRRIRRRHLRRRGRRAQVFFGKPASRLSAAESARLAAVLPSPRRYSVAKPGPYVQRRARWIERQVRHLGGPGYLTRLEHARSRAAAVTIRAMDQSRSPSSSPPTTKRRRCRCCIRGSAAVLDGLGLRCARPLRGRRQPRRAPGQVLRGHRRSAIRGWRCCACRATSARSWR